ncbi:MAG: CPBP family intramembrane metalloprotease [Bacteroidetes bacterium]|nr:CPBP family intramembrane metalloprotease [Bacteroidota bacterium]
MNLSATTRKVISLLVIAFIFAYPHNSYLPLFLYVPVVLTVLWIFLKYISKENFKDIFFRFKNFETKSIWIGALLAVIVFGLLQFAFMPLVKNIFPDKNINLKDFSFITHNPVNFIFVLLMALIVGGFYEELVFHGFIFTRFEKLFTGKNRFIISFVITNIIFAAYHYQQGILGVVNAFVAGSCYQAAILMNKKNLWYGLFFHSFYDFIGLTFIFLGYH